MHVPILVWLQSNRTGLLLITLTHPNNVVRKPIFFLRWAFTGLWTPPFQGETTETGIKTQMRQQHSRNYECTALTKPTVLPRFAIDFFTHCAYLAFILSASLPTALDGFYVGASEERTQDKFICITHISNKAIQSGVSDEIIKIKH